MPDNVPTERVPSSNKPGKKIPKVAIIGIGVGALALLYFLKKKKEKEESSPTGSEYTSQSFIPVTGENVAGVGAGGSGNFGGESNSSALLEAQKSYQEIVQSFLTSETESRREQEAGNREFLKEITESIRSQTGGGPPGEGQSGSGGGSGGGGSGTKTAPPSPPVVSKEKSQPSCGGKYPNKGPHGCYYSYKKGNKTCHKYQSGQDECF